MPLLQQLLRLTNFRNPLLRTIVPSVGAAFAIQTAVAVPSVLTGSERFYDVSGSLTYLAVTTLSLYLPALRARAAAAASAAPGVPLPPLPSLASALKGAAGTGFNWRQVVLSGAVAIWATRLGSYLFERILKEGHDSRFEEIRKSPPRFTAAFMAQATWVSLCMMPILAINSVPASAFAALSGAAITTTDVLGVGLFVGGLGFEVTADRQKSRWVAQKRNKEHDEEFLTKGLWSRSRFPNYFGEVSLWVGIATLAAGTLASSPVQAATGLSGGLGGRLAALSMCYISPAFVTFLLTKVSGMPLSERKYDKRYGGRKDYEEWKRNTPRFFPKLW